MNKRFMALLVAFGTLATIGTAFMQSARADDSAAFDPLVEGKQLFNQKDDSGHSCAECHPKGGSNGKILKGHRVPSLIDNVDRLSDSDLRDKIKKHLDEDVDLQLTDAQFQALMAFVSSLPRKGYGDDQ